MTTTGTKIKNPTSIPKHPFSKKNVHQTTIPINEHIPIGFWIDMRLYPIPLRGVWNKQVPTRIALTFRDAYMRSTENVGTWMLANRASNNLRFLDIQLGCLLVKTDHRMRYGLAYSMLPIRPILVRYRRPFDINKKIASKENGFPIPNKYRATILLTKKHTRQKNAPTHRPNSSLVGASTIPRPKSTAVRIYLPTITTDVASPRSYNTTRYPLSMGNSIKSLARKPSPYNQIPFKSDSVIHDHASRRPDKPLSNPRIGEDSSNAVSK